MQTGDPTKPTNPTRTDPSQPDLTPPIVSDRFQPLETNFGESSGGFHPQKPEPPNLPDKNSKKAENYLDLATI